MPDPRLDLAPLIEPVPPAPGTDEGAMPWMPAGVGLLLILLVAILAWWWSRRAPLRALDRLSRSNDPIAAAHALARLARNHGLKPDPAWQAELERLRFARPDPDAAITLARLCREAEALMRSANH